TGGVFSHSFSFSCIHTRMHTHTNKHKQTNKHTHAHTHTRTHTHTHTHLYLIALSPPCQGRNIVVFYGSQTGTAEEFANRLSKDAQRYGMKGMAADPEEYD